MSRETPHQIHGEVTSMEAISCRVTVQAEKDPPVSVTVVPPVNVCSMSTNTGPRMPTHGDSGTVNILPSSSSLVPRSFSDIACHHSRAGSDVSSETSRTSRASAGANLEKFFNEMGMEREVLDPIIQNQRHCTQNSERDIFESISSLDSHEARSICSAFSRSEKEMSDTESFERNQQQASAVERNARIIRWLSNVKKAKTPVNSVHGGASS